MPQWFTIASQLNGYVLDIEGANMSPGTHVVTYESNDQDNQFWYQDIYRSVIRSKAHTEFVMDIDDDGNLCINMYDPHSITQKLICGEDRIHTLADMGMVLDIANEDSSSGARVCLYEFNGQDNQVWSFNYVDQAYFVIRSAMNGLVLDVEGADTSAGANIVTYEFNGQDNQLWYEDRHGIVRSKLNDFVLDCSSGDIVLNPFDANNYEQGFAVVGEGLLNLRDNSQCVDIKGADSDSGAHLCKYEYRGSENQHWSIEYI